MPRGAKPKAAGASVTRHKPAHQWQSPEAVGWQFGETPEPPVDLKPETVEAWNAWFSSWWAGFWKVEDVPGLRLTVLHYDSVLRGTIKMAEVIPMLDRYGITPKGRQDLRWVEPKVEAPAVEESGDGEPRLRVVDAS